MPVITNLVLNYRTFNSGTLEKDSVVKKHNKKSILDNFYIFGGTIYPTLLCM